MQQGPWWYKLPLPGVAALDIEAVVEQGRQRIQGRGRWHSADLSDFVGCYTCRRKGREIKFAIDAHDLKTIVSPAALDWCDIYFKANKWSNKTYPEKIVPIVNGNGFLRKRHMDYFRRLRQRPKKYDVIFIFRIWGGIEHNTRLFEVLSRLPVKKRLVAIFVEGVGATSEIHAARKRLERVGVTCTSELLTARHLWQELAAAKVVVFRAGKHLCIPWRMIDLLCMGACVVTDSDFFPDWPERLQPGKHYISSGIKRPVDTSLAPEEEYDKLERTVTALLQDDALQNVLRKNCVEYFRKHAAPRKVGAYIYSQLEQL